MKPQYTIDDLIERRDELTALIGEQYTTDILADVERVEYLTATGVRLCVVEGGV